MLFILQAVETVVTTAVAAAILLANAPREGVTGEEVEEEEGEGAEDGVGGILMTLVMTRDMAFGDEWYTTSPPHPNPVSHMGTRSDTPFSRSWSLRSLLERLTGFTIDVIVPFGGDQFSTLPPSV